MRLAREAKELKWRLGDEWEKHVADVDPKKAIRLQVLMRQARERYLRRRGARDRLDDELRHTRNKLR